MNKARIRSSILILAILIAAALGVLRWQLSSKDAAKSASVPSTSAPAVATEQSPAQSSITSPSTQGHSAAESSVSAAAPEFEKMTREALEQLATQESVREQVKQDTHGLPKALITSGLLLGRIAEAVSKNPALEPRALEFYSECAASKKLANSIRALCLARFNRLEGSSESSKLAAGIPEAVRNLAEHAGL
jgi:hypothetical protein